MTRNRLPKSGLGRKRIRFTFDGGEYEGWEGDTLAAALLANGVHLTARSFKYHRPRGIYSAGQEEPNALVELHLPGRVEPNSKVTTVELFDGLVAKSQNRWPSLKLDLMGVNNLLSPVFTAGFYYKTFMWPGKWWMRYESVIRRAAGLGRASLEHDPDEYEKAHAFCDTLVIGAGPAGIEAALAASRSGRRVLLVEQDFEAGGDLLSDSDLSRRAWLEARLQSIHEAGNIKLMTRTTAFGFYDHNVVGLVEKVADHLPAASEYIPRQRMWTVRARNIIVAVGALERPFVFGNNDLPGIMLASAGRSYINRHAVRPGREAVIFTNNDSPYRQVRDMIRAGVKINAIVDSRTVIDTDITAPAEREGIRIHKGQVVTEAHGKKHLKAVTVNRYHSAGHQVEAQGTRLNCDLLLLSAGWSPVVHLQSHIGLKPVYDEDLAAFVPGQMKESHQACGAARGIWSWEDAVESGQKAGALAASDPQTAEPILAPKDNLNIQPLWVVPTPEGKKLKKFVDLQHDVTADDVAQAHREGYVSVEHLKRYTTLGMATDQGKLSNINGLAIMAEQRQEKIQQVGTTVFRPPYSPISIGALAGRERGRHFRPERLSPLHDRHFEKGAKWTQTGLWQRAWYYPKEGETVRHAYIREAAAVRASVGMTDVSTLGKIDVQGPDAAEFLNRVYVNGWKGLPVGKARYGVMLREDGYVLDDGTTSRISDHHFFMTTTTANAGKVMTHLEYLLECVWPDLKVHVTSVTEQWAGMAIAGPNARSVLSSVIRDVDFTNQAFPFMGVRHGHVKGVRVRICRISFSGEQAYEIYSPAGFGCAIWDELTKAGEAYGMTHYGTEALGAMRIEKGHVAGPELDGRTTLADLGLDKMASSKKPYLGQVLARREGMAREDRPTLVGLKPVYGSQKLSAGSILFTRSAAKQGHGEGHVSSTTYSPVVGQELALGLLVQGKRRVGEVVMAVNPTSNEEIPVEVVSPHFHDPKGEKMHA